MEKFICVHGHFYQPPRENPWLEAVELQDSASPYHDWNERITAECYAPNAYARCLDGEGHIECLVNNYSRISFNFGPTLLSWMKDKAPEIYQAILDADKAGQKEFFGHGPALAQCYNHMIMPLANERDKRTQVLWGIRDFETRFGRKPEGMWLPETAADETSLDALAREGIKFTILSPFQASRTRPLGSANWQDVNGGHVDPSMPYIVKLPAGRSIAVFFYDAPIAKAVAFEQLLMNGDQFARRLMDAFSDSRGSRAQLAHIATDGESYGHHYRFGDMALASATRAIDANKDIHLTIYGAFLEKHPPTHEVEIHQASAWSCSHGVGRWQRNCGCNSGGRPGWNQEWREPLRNALDWLREQLTGRFETRGREFLKDPWAARDDYIAVILDRSPENIAQFLGRHASRELNEADQVTTLRLLEMQRHAMLMYTSCGWFFDEISGIETVQVIQYAARAIQLANDLFGEDLEPGFLGILEKAKSNIPEHRDGRLIYEKFVKPAIITRESLGAHYAISSLFETYTKTNRIYSFTVEEEERQLITAGNARLAMGRIKLTFEITRNSDVITYSVLHLGEHNLNCGVRSNGDPEKWSAFEKEMRATFEHADFAGIIRLMDHHFGDTHYSLKNIFRDEQRKVLKQIFAAMHDDIFNAYRLITDRYSALGRFLTDIGAPAPRSLQVSIELVLNSELRQQFEGDTLDQERIRSLLAECTANKVNLDTEALGYAIKAYLDRLSDQFQKSPEDAELMQRLETGASLARTMPFETNLWKTQNIFYELLTRFVPEMQQRALNGDAKAKKWTEQFRSLGLQLGFHVT